jgi:hypothetical protein
MISEVIKFQDNGMVLVFDEKGEQIVEFQGKYQDVRVKILARAPKKAKFYHGTWPQGRSLVPRREW